MVLAIARLDPECSTLLARHDIELIAGCRPTGRRSLINRVEAGRLRNRSMDLQMMLQRLVGLKLSAGSQEASIWSLMS